MRALSFNDIMIIILLDVKLFCTFGTSIDTSTSIVTALSFERSIETFGFGAKFRGETNIS